uniref:F-box protein 43 n=1 Tax=Pundamilia nyererei TaxID=303518 RepID=A0A3B4F9G0_9CICH
MQCTPESSLYLDGYKGQHCYDDCSDSGYSGFFQSPHSTSGADSCRSLSPVELDETPKENLRVSVTPKKIREQVRFLGRDSRKVSAVSWCETPKICKRDTSLRQRLLLCKPTVDVKNDNTRSPCTRRIESPVSGSEPYLNTSFDSVDTEMGALDQDLPLSGRKRRVLFTQVRTSTLEDGKHNCCRLPSFEKEASLTDLDMSEHIFASGQCNVKTPGFNEFLSISKENSQSPLGSMTDNLYNGSSVLCTPSSAHTPSYIRSLSEDSGFSSVTLDKSQDSTVDHDGSFQELLLSASKGNSETPNPTEGRRRSRLQRQHRLSTLKEGGSQSEEDPTDRNSDHLVNLSLTPALQLVQAMCQHHAQMLAGQSPSLKEQLKSAAALTKTPSTLRTTMPLAGLIGRKMGLEKVDILTELMKRNLRHILAVILCQMDSESVYSCVCKSWNQILQQDKLASTMRRSHLSQVEAALELGAAVHVADAETRAMLLKRSALKTVQAQSRTSSYCTPQSGSRALTPLQLSALHSDSSSKRDKFLEVAKTLFNDECLKPCPRCQHPARCHSGKREGVCSRADCGFQFCMSCLCTSHGSRECGSHSAGRRRKDILPGSAQSKRNVKRL